MEEIWKDIPGYEGFYMVSNLGRIKSVPRKVFSVMSPTGTRVITEKIHVPNDNGHGYKYFSIKINGDKKSNFYIHKAVALAFLSNSDNHPEINHIDGNKSNNAVSNLEWCSKSQNMRHAFDNGLMNPARGINKHGCKLTEDDIREIRRLVRAGEMMQIHVADKFNVSRGYIWHIMNDKWQHVK